MSSSSFHSRLLVLLALAAARVASAGAVVQYYFELDDMYFFGKFGGYDSVSVSLSSDSTVDFWITDKANFDDWKDQETIPTPKMFPGTYCSNCLSHSTVFTNPTPGSGDYYWVISAVFPERGDADGQITLTYSGSGYFDEPEEEDDSVAVCFSAAATVEREDGAVVPIGELTAGESILAVGLDGEVGYSPVLSVPHRGKNRRYSSFFQIHLEGEDSKEALEMTRNHLVLTCQQQEDKEGDKCSSCPDPAQQRVALSPLTMLAPAQDVTTSTCLLRVTNSSAQWMPVSSISSISNRKGIYSVVTKAAYPVVSGVAASPFAVSHLLPHAFYSYILPLYSALSQALGFNANEEAMASGFSVVLDKAILFVTVGLEYVASSVHSFGSEL